MHGLLIARNYDEFYRSVRIQLSIYQGNYLQLDIIIYYILWRKQVFYVGTLCLCNTLYCSTDLFALWFKTAVKIVNTHTFMSVFLYVFVYLVYTLGLFVAERLTASAVPETSTYLLTDVTSRYNGTILAGTHLIDSAIYIIRSLIENK